MDSEHVQTAVILDRLEIAILLLDKEERECVRGFGLADISFFQVLCNELLQSDIFSWGQWIYFAIHHVWGVRFQIDSVISFAQFRESMRSFLTEDLGVFVIVGWDDLIPGLNCFIGGFLGELLHDSGLCSVHGIDFHDTEI